MRRAAKRDLSEPAIVDALQKLGALVYRELPVDLLVFYRGRFMVLECKTEGQPKHSRKRCKGQDDFIKATGCPVVKTPEMALTAVLGFK